MRKRKLKIKKIKWTIISLLMLVIVFFTLNRKDILSGFFKDIFYLPTIFIKTPPEYDVVGDNINIELQKEKIELAKLLEINTTMTDFDKINAVVVERNTAYWFNYLTINKGTKDGIKTGMIVVNGDGLVGTIKEANYLTSTVKLITSNDNYNKISVQLDNGTSTINKILITDNNRKIILGIDNTFKLKEGNHIYTSGLSDIFPRGINIGTVSKIENDSYGISQKVIVKLAANINELRFVIVLLRGNI